MEWIGQFLQTLEAEMQEAFKKQLEESNQEDDNNNDNQKKGEVDVKTQTWCAGNNSALAGKRLPQESKQMMLSRRKGKETASEKKIQ